MSATLSLLHSFTMRRTSKAVSEMMADSDCSSQGSNSPCGVLFLGASSRSLALSTGYVSARSRISRPDSRIPAPSSPWTSACWSDTEFPPGSSGSDSEDDYDSTIEDLEDEDVGLTATKPSRLQGGFRTPHTVRLSSGASSQASSAPSSTVSCLSTSMWPSPTSLPPAGAAAYDECVTLTMVPAAAAAAASAQRAQHPPDHHARLRSPPPPAPIVNTLHRRYVSTPPRQFCGGDFGATAAAADARPTLAHRYSYSPPPRLTHPHFCRGESNSPPPAAMAPICGSDASASPLPEPRGVTPHSVDRRTAPAPFHRTARGTLENSASGRSHASAASSPGPYSRAPSPPPRDAAPPLGAAAALQPAIRGVLTSSGLTARQVAPRRALARLVRPRAVRRTHASRLFLDAAADALCWARVDRSVWSSSASSSSGSGSGGGGARRQQELARVPVRSITKVARAGCTVTVRFRGSSGGGGGSIGGAAAAALLRRWWRRSLVFELDAPADAAALERFIQDLLDDRRA
ncbi:hypothetical protein JKP88DRAFT_347500 [Tribonema minus]|uniref:Uncharacterized protein n=1 Tax=Tribonema minus TaxID=303371 RepID=A0A835ZI43_9STRA|nr:hypothetical protein JKP88DRAFT_347500 [Tribonema minus]